MKVADFTSPSSTPLNVRVTYSSAADLLCTLWILGGRRCGDAISDLDIGDEWFDEFEARLSPETDRDLDDIGTGDTWISLVPLLPEVGDGATVDDFISYIDAMDPADLRYRIARIYDLFGDDDRELVADAAEGDRDAVARMLDAPALGNPEKKQWRDTLRFLFELDPHETQQLLVRVLRRVQDEAFAPHEEAFRPVLEADFRSKRALARRVSPQRLLEIATSGIEFTDDHTSKPMVLVPTMVVRPWVVFAAGSDYFVLGYPVADEHIDADGDAPPQWLVKLHKALGDERRLRLLRTLAQGDASLADLAEEADVAKSTLHHHLMLLRAAGLVRIQIGEEKRYSLREETIADAASVLDHYIHTSPTTGESS